MELSKSISKIAELIKASDRLLITAGAGMGVDSGMPDFRGKEGFWNTFKPFQQKYSFVDCANPRFLREHPYEFWGFYGYRFNMYNTIIPHKGFDVLLKLSKLGNIKDFFVVTSNVDGHFQKSGFEEKKVYEIHGSINYFQCNKCYNLFEYKEKEIKIDPEKFEAFDPLPTCLGCSSKSVRPNILMFGDCEWDSRRSDEQESQYQEFKYNLRNGKNLVVLEFGAGLAVPTIRFLGEQFLNNLKINAYLVRINLRDFTSSEKNNINLYNIKSKCVDFLIDLQSELGL